MLLGMLSSICRNFEFHFLIVRLDPHLVLFLEPSGKGSTELLQKLKELVDQYDQATFTQLIEDGLTSMYNNVDQAWVTPLYTEIINEMLECETQWRVRGGAGIANPNGVQIVDYLKVLLRGHQAKYGKKIVPDSQHEI